ncbi:MAG: TraR/DksA C4-type zinc finger protein [Patescibacteria group bacterium]
MENSRYLTLKTILGERRQEVLDDVHAKLQEQAEPLAEGADRLESAEADIQEDIEFALIQMKAETLQKIDEALVRLEEGNYGYCLECDGEIAEGRLRSLPFAVRCKDCEEAREAALQRERVLAQRRGPGSLFSW